MPQSHPKTTKKGKPQITLITLIFYFFIICVNLGNLWSYFIAAILFTKISLSSPLE